MPRRSRLWPGLPPAITTLERRDCPSYVCSIASFGAIGDGRTDDTAAIQAAIASVPKGGGAVIVPAGDYRISQPLVITTSDTVLLGAGPNASELQLTDAGANSVVEVTGNGARILSLHIDGNRDFHSGEYGGVYLAGCDSAIVWNCLVSNFAYDGLEIGGGFNSNITISTDYFLGCGRNGLAIGNASHVAIVDCTFNSIGSQFWKPGGLQQFQNAIDLEVQGSDSSISNVVVQDCTFYDPYAVRVPRNHRTFAGYSNVIRTINQLGPVANLYAVNDIVNGRLIRVARLFPT